MKKLILASAMMTAITTSAQEMPGNLAAEPLRLTQEWDKTFAPNDKVDHRKVTFVNCFGITLAADLYVPKGAAGKMPAIAVSGPFGAVKEQAAGLYAQRLAQEGFVTMAFDPSFTGESGGAPRSSVPAVQRRH